MNESKIEEALNYLLQRFSEPSTWAAITALTAAFGLSIPDGLAATGMKVAAGIAGLAAILMKETPVQNNAGK